MDLRWLGFQRRRRKPALWRRPCWPARLRWRYDPRFEPCADGVEWIAVVENETWLAADRLWHGWPDPPEWAFWALDAGGEVVCVWDFDDWPSRWRRAEAPPGCGGRTEAGA